MSHCRTIVQLFRCGAIQKGFADHASIFASLVIAQKYLANGCTSLPSTKTLQFPSNSHRESGALGESADRTAIGYDAAGRIVSQKVQSSDGYNTIHAQATMTYTMAGQLATQLDGRGNATSLTYNSRGLIATETLPDADGDGSQFSLIVSHAYDNMGRETSTDRGFDRVTSLEYNSRSWITKITKPDPDGSGSLSSPIIQIGYNARGDRTTRGAKRCQEPFTEIATRVN